MENSKIEWTNHTFNPWWGCMKVSEGCKNCYAETLDNRWQGGHWGPGSDRKQMSEEHWRKPFKWNEDARKAGVKAKVFCASMADVFEDHPQLPALRARLFAMIVDTPHLIWQLLTKRPENILAMVPQYWLTQEWPANVWIGTSVENQKAADERIPHLIKVPAQVRFLSCEPLLGNVSISDFLSQLQPINDETEFELSTIGRGIQWVICGGESGHGARPIHPAWARSLRNQCATAGVPFFFKQWGEWVPELQSVYIPNTAKHSDVFVKNVATGEDGNFDYEGFYVAKVGKKAAGAVLDGKEHKEFPA